MGARRTTFGKTQRERDKKAKAAAKRERREAATRSGAEAEPAPVVGKQHDEQSVLRELEALHRRYAEAEIGLEEFEARRDELRARLHVS